MVSPCSVTRSRPRSARGGWARMARRAGQEQHLEQVAGRAREADDVALARLGPRVAARAPDDVEGVEDLARRRRQAPAIARRAQFGALEQAGQELLARPLGHGAVAV